MSGPEQGTTRDDVGRCSRCGARVVPGQDWCSLCLEPLAAPAGAQDAVAAPGEDPVDPAGEVPVDPVTPAVRTDPTDPMDPVDPSDPYAAVPQVTPGSSGDLPPGAAEAMLAELAATSAAGRPLAGGPLAGRGRGVRGLLGCGAAVVLVGLLVLLLTLLDLLV